MTLQVFFSLKSTRFYNLHQRNGLNKMKTGTYLVTSLDFLTFSLHRWRAVEASLASCASIAGDLIDLNEEADSSEVKRRFDPTDLLVGTIPSLLENMDCPLLQGRCLVFAGKFSSIIPSDIAGRYGNLSAQVIESQRSELSLKLCAVKAIKT
jgi:hypothetical protein